MNKETTRKLASVQQVIDTQPIEGADAIEVASVLGWKCVTRKSEFNPGDLGIFFEIDSVLPEKPCFEFMRQRKFRVRTVRLRGQLSQGLFMPLSLFPELNGMVLTEGDDVTELLGITKYDPPGQHGGISNRRAGYPPHVNKADEVRVQSEPSLREALLGLPYVATVKMDGTSGTFTMVDGEFHACSRNLSVKDEEGSPYWTVARKYHLPELLAQYPHLAIQGEICGPAIQGNKPNLKEVDLFVFDIYDKQQGRYLLHGERTTIILDNGLTRVPVEEVGDDFQYTLEELLEKAKGKYTGTTNEREGLVFRTLNETPHPLGANGRLSFKVLSDAFLLKEKD